MSGCVNSVFLKITPGKFFNKDHTNSTCSSSHTSKHAKAGLVLLFKGLLGLSHFHSVEQLNGMRTREEIENLPFQLVLNPKLHVYNTLANVILSASGCYITKNDWQKKKLKSKTILLSNSVLDNF